MKLTQELFEKAIEFAKNRRETSGDAQAGSAEFERSSVKDEEVILSNKPLGGWRHGEVELTRVKLSDIADR